MVKNLEKTTEIFKELYKDKNNLKIVTAAIYSKTYTDESVLLKDLLYPNGSLLSKNKKFIEITNKLNVELISFSKSFFSIALETNDSEFQSFLQNLNKVSDYNLNSSSLKTNVNNYENYGDDVSIYYPYSEEFIDNNINDNDYYYAPITTIATATAEADEGWGSQPYYLNGVFQGYNQVLINDEYAELNPTHIIGINGIEPDYTSNTVSAAFPPQPPISLPGTPREIKQVYVGDVRCRHQYDVLISLSGNGGGSEIRFTRADGFLKVVDGQVQADVFLIGDGSINRRAIRNNNWVDFSREWDGDWELTNHQQNLAIYEDDNRNSSTINGSLSTTVKVPAAGGLPEISTTRNIGFTINFKSDDAIIKQINFNRDVFFVLNRTNLEGEMKNGWPVRDKTANVSFTLNDRTYY